MTDEQIDRLIAAVEAATNAIEAVADKISDIDYTLERFMEKTLTRIGSEQYAVRTLPCED